MPNDFCIYIFVLAPFIKKSGPPWIVMIALCVSYLSFFDHYKILEDFFIIDKKENRVHSTFDCDN